MHCIHCGEQVVESAKYCAACGENVQRPPDEERWSEPPAPTSPSRETASPSIASYYPVSFRYLAVLSVLTFGLYEVYWFYKNWVFIRNRDQSNIWPWARALWGMVYYGSLAGDLAGSQTAKRIVPRGSVILYFLLFAASRLPEPFFYLSFLTFLPLYPAVEYINSLNAEDLVRNNSRLGIKLVGILIFTVPFLFWSVSETIGLVPSASVISGSQVSASNRSFLESSGIIEPSEQILYFYSEQFFSITDAGNILTARRVISYETVPETGERWVESAMFSNIASFTSEKGNDFTDTELTINLRDGSSFLLYLSTEEQDDDLFIDRLRSLAPLATSASPAASSRTRSASPR